MRAAALVLLAAAVFAGFVLQNLREGRRTVEGERAVLARLGKLRGTGPSEAREEGGYRFAWLLGEDLPPLLLARPLDAGNGRWFAAGVDGPLYAYDTVVRRAPGGVPDTGPLRAHLARPAAERPADPPGGWGPAGP